MAARSAVSPVELWHDSILLGHVHQVAEHDGVYLGVIQLSITDAAEPSAQDLLRYVEFCVGWNERTRSERNPPSASEFDAFAPIIKSRKWFTKSGGVVEAIEDAPVFFKGNEVSWRSTRTTRS